MQRDWFVACGECDARLTVRDAAIVREGGSCANCADLEAEVDVDGARVVTELGWCVCDRPWEVDRMMLAYLDARAADWPEGDGPKAPAEGVSDDAETLLAYIADDLRWTEHGGSVGGAWLTDAGRAARENLRVAASASTSN